MLKVAEVIWGDAWIGTQDIKIEKALKLKPVTRRTVGYLVGENDEAIILCTDQFDESKKTVSAPMVIPRGWIIKYWEYHE